MIIVNTTLDMHVSNGLEKHQGKYVTVRMEGDDAFALATILMNNTMDVNDEWKAAISKFASALVTAGNSCR